MIEYTYEEGKDRSGKTKLVKREAKRIFCKKCNKSWLVRKDREHSNLCRRCKVSGENNPMFGTKSWNNGIKTYVWKEYAKKYYKRMRFLNRIKAIEYLGNKCNICKTEDLPICCWDLHHIEPHKKENNISCLLAYKWEKLKQELDKCVLLCCMCHRVLHHGNHTLKEILEKENAI